ncbi:hypothetical protein [Alkaliflexus imshenetskii]|uniref:hypothetical protein n=1 Tax=Alkaliflexus imshenetskii TaxID=286730 RepID=UPI00047E09B9|nr:hypothetical protein [Alkaliflexus imshenetskii]
MRKHLKNIAPLMAALLLWTLAYQSVHRIEHHTNENAQHTSCCHSHHCEIPSKTNSDADTTIDDDQLVHCHLCEFEFVLFPDNVVNENHKPLMLPKDEIIAPTRSLHSNFEGCQKQLRAPPATTRV